MQGSLFHPTISRMGNTQPTASSPLASPSRPSPVDLQAHLYASLLEGHTADVTLRIRGAWEAIYKLHRVVLIQAGFFRSLFTNGFAETHGGSNNGQGEILVVFDDPNITRAAFELCVARLYGGGPPLHIEPSLIPSLSEPLTPGYPAGPKATPLPGGHHPATPRLLLSLIATAVYLSLPAVASQALAAVLGSVGPRTVVRYLNFACGKGIGSAGEDEPEAAVGLENLAKPIPRASSPTLGSPAVMATPPIAGSPPVAIMPLPNESEHGSYSVMDVDHMDFQKEGAADTEDEHSSHHERDDEPSYEYGAVSSKIGEAVACWLARWGGDLLAHEQKAFSSGASAVATAPGPSKRRATVPSQPKFAGMDIVSPQSLPKIWSRSGLSAKWASALLSSDLLFVRGERERYDLAKAVVELRRQEGILPEEEEEWTNLFSCGIYYSNMLMEDMSYISQDVSPSAQSRFVPLSVVQASHWDQSLLQHRIMARPTTGSPVSPPGSPAPHDKELGLVKTTSDLLQDITLTAGGSSRAEAPAAVYHPVPVDSSSRVGDATGLESATMEELFDMPAPNIEKRKAGRTCFRESSFFGLASDRRRATDCVAEDSSGKARWSPHPPFRFGVEFWAVDALREKSRLHSHTIWYAGSLYNVYVQVVRKKGIQLGVYLHRQSTVDPLPPASAPAPAVPLLRTERSHMHRPSLPESQLAASVSMPSIHRTTTGTTPRSTTPRSQTPVSASRSAFTASSSAPDTDAPVSPALPPTAQAIAPAQPYRDPRPAVSAYFTIACQSATGSSLTRFSSAPDVFSVSQSWGWKSSSLRTEEYLDVAEEGAPGNVPRKKEISLRATVVLGLV